MGVFIAAALCGVGIGLFSGLLGIGGGTVMVPLLVLAFGLPAVGATATSLFTIIPTSVSGVVKHLKNRTCIPKLGLCTGLAGACFSPLGVLAANASPSWLVILAAACIILYSAYTMIKKALNAPKKPAASAGGEAAKPVDFPEFELTPKKLVIGILIGVVAGFASGYVGVGGGFIMVPMFLGVLGVMMRQASGTSLVAVMILATPGVITQCMLGNVDYVAGIALACGTIPGAFIGASLITKIPERTLRFVFAGFLVISGVLLLARELPIFGA